MRPTGPSTLRRFRLTAMVAVLALALVVTGILAWQAVSARRHQRTAAQATLADYADFAAFVLGSGVYREAGRQALYTFAALPAWADPALFDRAGDDFGCGGRGVYFEFEPATATLRHAPGAMTWAAEKRLTDTLANVRTLFNEAAWRFRYVGLPLDGVGDGFFLVPVTLEGGFGVRGLTSCLWQDSTFRTTMARWTALPPSLTGTTPGDSLYAIRLTSERTVLLDEGHRFDSVLTGSARLGPEFGDLTLGVALNAAQAPELLIGGIPDSRAPAALILFVLNALLLAAAVALLRRDYRMIDARSEFVSSVSHELRTPLSQILLFTELLRLDRLSDAGERVRALGIIDAEARRLIRLVENILQFSKPERTAPLATEPLNLAEFVRETVAAFRPLADARRTAIVMEVPEDLTVRGERNALRQVLLNLLDNAVKYGPEGQQIVIEGRAEVAGDFLVLAVEDQGPGVPAPDRERIWEGFERLERDDAPVAGSGIGLAVVRSLVHRMGGTVAVADAPTGGGRFTVRLGRLEAPDS